jgi:S-DNA-T family DNA segregation ATPase FtsK/SpoIIIE
MAKRTKTEDEIKKETEESEKIEKQKKTTIAVIKIITLLISIFILLSLLVSQNSIMNDINNIKNSNFKIYQIFYNKSIIIHNRTGILGAFTAHFLVRYFGQFFCIIFLFIYCLFTFLSFAKVDTASIKKYTLLIFSIIFHVNLMSFYFNIMFDIESLLRYNNSKILFGYLFLFLSRLIGPVGVLIYCIFALIITLQILLNINPLTFMAQMTLNIKDLFLKAFKHQKKEDDQDEEIEEKTTSKTKESKPISPTVNAIVNEQPAVESPVININDVPEHKFKVTKKTYHPDDTKYKKPEIELFLHKPNIDKSAMKAKIEAEIKNVSKILVDKLEEFNIKANVLNVNIGPIITQYELEPAPGVKVKEFPAHADDLTLALKAKSIRVQAPIPGRGLIGVEIPNIESDVIYMRDIFLSSEMQKSTAILSVALGKDIAGRPIVTDLSRTPHLLIAGATGSGKSVCINTIICSLLLRCTPEEVRLVMIDPKRIELSGYDNIPHLIQSVVTDPEDAMKTLSWAVYEMERRYELLQELKVRDITSYNQKMEELFQQEEAEDIDKLPYIVVIVDEFADLIMTAGREIEQPITRLAQMARAVGIHLILATQRPSTKVITGVIKANFPARIAFRVSSQIDSRVILDSVGAEKLLGRGDMLYLPPGKISPERIHGAYLSDSEIENLVAYLLTQPKPQLNITMNKPEKVNLKDFDYDDDLFPEAMQIVVRSQTASVSMLQRHFKIGYARAGRLIDLLEQAGVVGPHLGSKSREVIMKPEDL